MGPLPLGTAQSLGDISAASDRDSELTPTLPAVSFLLCPTQDKGPRPILLFHLSGAVVEAHSSMFLVSVLGMDPRFRRAH